MATMSRGDRGEVGVSTPGRAYWRAHVEAQQRSALSRAVFCARQGLHPGTFSFWKWKLARDAGAARRRAVRRTRRKPTFIPIRITRAHGPQVGVVRPTVRDGVGEIEITLGHDRSVRVRGPVEVEWLAHVLRVVETLGC